MDNKIMRIYYGSDNLPYKDEERTVHYPIVGKVGGGSVFTGENNTTTIYFYVGLVGSNSKTWVATIKKPDGTLLYRVLSNGVATDDDYYVTLDIAEIYANQVGTMVIGLNGYDGSTNITIDDDDLVINGNTTCLSLGTVNILCNYAPQVLTNAYGLDPSDLQLLLTAINEKADKDGTIIVVATLNNTLTYDDGQIVFSISAKKFYKYVEGETYPDNFVEAQDYYTIGEVDTLLSNYYTKTEVDTTLGNYYTKTETNNLLNTKQDKLISGTNIKTINGVSILGSGDLEVGGGSEYTAGSGIVIDSDNEISVDNSVIYNKTQVDNLLSGIKRDTYQVVDYITYPTLADFLSTTGQEGIMYLYPIDTSDLTKGYYRYVYENSAWLSLGTTQIDLSNYYTKTEIDSWFTNVNIDEE